MGRVQARPARGKVLRPPTGVQVKGRSEDWNLKDVDAMGGSGKGEDLESPEELCRSLVESSPDLIAIVDREGRIQFLNRRADGTESTSFIGSSMFDLLEPDDPEEARRVLRDVFETGTLGSFEGNRDEGEGGPGRVQARIGPVIRGGEVAWATLVAHAISKETEAEEALKESEERYRNLTDATFEGLVIHSGGMILDTNRRIEELSGYTRADLVGTPFVKLLDPESMDVVKRAIEEDWTDPYEIDVRAKDGGMLHLEVLGKSMSYKGGTARVAAIRDISRRRQQEEALRRSEARYRLLAENVDDILFTLKPDLSFSYVSPSFERRTGFTVTELRDMGWQDIMTVDSLERVTEMVTEDVLGVEDPSKARERRTVIEAELLTKGGGAFWAEVNVIPLRDHMGEVTGLLGVARDITDRKAAESALRESEQRYRLLAENVADVIFVLGMDMTFSYVSPSLERLTGFTAEEMEGHGWQEVLTPGSLEHASALVAERLIESMESPGDGGDSVMLVMELVTKAGGSRWAEVNLSLMQDPDGVAPAILGVARDITERRRTQESFLEEKKRAELYLDLFGHDIRNINQGIMSYLELLQMKPDVDGTEANYIRNVLEQATRINDLVAKVQRLTHLRTADIRVEDVDALRIIQGAVDYINAKYPDRDLVFETDPGCSNHSVRGSRLLHDVFVSILENAVRFDRHPQVVIGILCREAEAGIVRFEFEDHGPGIPGDMKEKVFKRLDQPEGTVKGSGLGLTVVWEIIKRLDGRVWIEDRVAGDHRHGSRFVVELPRGGDGDRK